MKTGFNLDRSSGNLTTNEKLVIMSGLRMMLQCICRIAEIITVHSDRHIITVRDVQQGAKFVCNTGLDVFLMERCFQTNRGEHFETNDIWIEVCKSFPILEKAWDESGGIQDDCSEEKHVSQIVMKTLFEEDAILDDVALNSEEDQKEKICLCPLCLRIGATVENFDNGKFDHPIQLGCIRKFITCFDEK